MTHASGWPPTFDWQLPPGHWLFTLQLAPTFVPPTHSFMDAQPVSALQPWNVAFGPQNCSNGPPAHSPSLPAAQVPPGHSEAALQFAF